MPASSSWLPNKINVYIKVKLWKISRISQNLIFSTFFADFSLFFYLVISFSVEVWHIPSILFIVVIVGVGAVVGGGNTFSIGGRGSIVEIYSTKNKSY